jgi:hypothetical protein
MPSPAPWRGSIVSNIGQGGTNFSPILGGFCINFNDAIKKLFGSQYGLERRAPGRAALALQPGEIRRSLRGFRHAQEGVSFKGCQISD